MIDALNDDVLDRILKLYSTPSLAALTFVSSRSYVIALPHLLRCIFLGKNTLQCAAFFNYVLDHTQRRIPNNSVLSYPSERGRPGKHIRKLQLAYSVCTQEFDEEECTVEMWAPLLTRAPEVMPNIRSVVIEARVEDIVSHSPGFAHALLTRPFLARLELRFLGTVASNRLGQALKSAPSPAVLQRVKFAYGSTSDEQDHTTVEYIGAILFHSRKSLIQVALDGYDLYRVLANPDSGNTGVRPLPRYF
ncbi:hypothetical protein CPB84DRAFT_188339, partial [Gymnopilus junonius]